MRWTWSWIRWEASRSIELTPFLRFIIVERFIKASVLVLGGMALLVLSATSDLHRFAVDAQAQLQLDAGRGLLRRAYTTIATRFGNASAVTRDEIAVGAILYGLLDAIEGLGLLLRRRWAEYLVLIATGAFLPLEIDELVRKPSPLKALVLLVNIGIIVYLVWRKRLFVERPQTARAEAVPA